MILTVTLNPCIDQVLTVQKFRLHDANRVLKVEQDAGGKSVNVSRILAELGGRTVATGFLGGNAGTFIRTALDAHGVPHDFVEVAGETRTNIAVEEIDGKAPTSLNARGPEVGKQELERLFRHVEGLLNEVSWLAMGGSLSPGVPPEVYRDLTQLGHAHGCQVLVDADDAVLRLALEAKPDFVKPNRPEAERLLGRPVRTPEEACTAAHELFQQLGGGSRVVMVSMGAPGAALAYSEGVLRGYSPQVQVKSTTGCGDSMLGAMLWAFQEQIAVPSAFRWGLAAGAATAATDGTEIASREAIENLFQTAEVEPVA